MIRLRDLSVAIHVGMAAMLGMACAVQAFDMPGGAVRVAGITEALSDRTIATGPFDGSAVPGVTAEGTVTQSAWRLAGNPRTTLDLLSELRGQLEGEGFKVIYDCATAVCGGFDFRYALDILPEPEMHVDLGDFRYLAASRGAGAGVAYLMILVSRSSENGFVQVTEVLPPGAPAAAPAGTAPDTPEPPPAEPVAPGAAAEPDPSAPPTGLAEALETRGSAAMDDLVFPSGSSALVAGDFASLRDLAAYLAQRPDRRVTIVGHTDATGPLAGNIVLSKQRARSVADRLVRDHGVAPAQVSAEGAGYLAPRATNLTDEGRTRNRRVEVMLTSTR